MNQENRTCVDCSKRITRDNEPPGIIMVRVRDKFGGWTEHAICTGCYHDRRNLVFEPTRMRWLD